MHDKEKEQCLSQLRSWWPAHLVRAAERIVGAQCKYKKWHPYCVRGFLGTHPQKILMLWSVFWGLLRFHLCASIQYIPTCQLLSFVAVLDWKIRRTGPLPAVAQRSRKIICIILKFASAVWVRSKKAGWLEIQRNEPLKKLGCELMNRIIFERVQHCLGPPSHWGPGTNFPSCPSCQWHCT